MMTTYAYADRLEVIADLLDELAEWEAFEADMASMEAEEPDYEYFARWDSAEAFLRDNP